MTAKDISRLLIDCHRKRGWRADVEFRFQPRRLDVLAISQNGLDVVGYEIKISIADFRSEMRNSAKRLASQDYCTEFYYVVPFGMVEAHEVPMGCGLLYCELDYFLMVKRSPTLHRRTIPPEIEILRCAFDKITQSDYSEAFDDMPSWAAGRTPARPFRFQFDIPAAAAKIPGFVNSVDIDFDGVPFGAN